MLTLISRRLVFGIVTLWVVSVLVFAGTEILPGDVAEAILGQNATPESLKAIRDSLGLERPPHERYLEWMTSFAMGDMGSSLGSGRDVAVQVSERLGNTIRLATFAAAVAVPLAIALGLLGAMFPGGLLDRSIALGTLCVISVPEFFIAALLVMVFAVTLRWFPAVSLVQGDMDLGRLLRALSLPVLTLTLAILAHMSRMTRAAVLNVMTSPYVEMAILKGLSRRRIILRHALPNALSPIITVVALNLAYLVSGVVVVETVFAYPGLAKLLVDAVASRDIPLVQASAMIFCGTYVVLNLMADVLSMAANPRLRHPK